MSQRTSLNGNGMPGGKVEYKGDLTPPTSSYASSFNSSSIGRRLRFAAATLHTGSAVVSRRPRRGGLLAFLSYGARLMKQPVPVPAGYGNVQPSGFQQLVVQLQDWHINPSWYEAGYPRNLGLSQRTPQPQTNVVGAPGRSRMTPHPLFTRVQNVPRAKANIRVYNTRGQ